MSKVSTAGKLWSSQVAYWLGILGDQCTMPVVYIYLPLTSSKGSEALKVEEVLPSHSLPTNVHSVSSGYHRTKGPVGLSSV